MRRSRRTIDGPGHRWSPRTSSPVGDPDGRHRHANAAEVFGLDLGDGIGITLIGLGFMTLIALVNHRGVGESVKTNVVLTCVELSGLLIVIGVGVWALGIGEGDFSRVTEFDTGDDSVLTGVIAATGLAFFAMVGFEDSVIMAEECKEPRRIFPKVLLLGLGITGVIYVLVSISAIALVPADQLSEGETPLLQVVEAGAPGFPIGLFGVCSAGFTGSAAPPRPRSSSPRRWPSA